MLSESKLIGVLFLSASDVTYRDGSLFHSMTGAHLLIVVTGIIMTAILTLGLLRREKTGPASIDSKASP